jgi:hypothetical protein
VASAHDADSYGYNEFRRDVELWCEDTFVPSFKRRTDRLFAWSSLDNFDSEAKHDLSTVLWAVAFILTQGLTLIASLQSTNPIVEIRRGQYVLKRVTSNEESNREETKAPSPAIKIFLYLFSALFPFGFLWNMVHSAVFTKYGKTHFYNRPTVSCARWSQSVGIFFVGMIGVLACAQSLPGQTIHVTGTEFSIYKFKTDQANGIAVTLAFAVEGMPADADTIHFVAALGDQLRDGWRIADISGTVKSPKGKIEPASVSPDPKDLRTKSAFPVDLLDAKVGNVYTVTVLIRPKEGKTPDRQQALAILHTDGKAFRFTLAE